VIKSISFLLALIICFQLSSYELGPFYYISLGISFLLLIPFSKVLKLNFKILVFLLILLITIFLNDIPDYYRPYQRFISFIFLICLVGPFLLNFRLIYFRNSLFNYFMFFTILSQIVTFIFFLTNNPIAFDRSGFRGLYTHSMVLGPMSAICCLYIIYRIKSNKNTLFKVFLTVFLTISFLNLLLASSRSALLAFIISLLLLVYYFATSKKQLISFFLVILVSGFLLFPTMTIFTEGLQIKNNYGFDSENLLISRESLWQYRIDEFLSSPLYGIGFSNDTRLNDIILGTVEPGSSWLVLLSMTGIIGFLSFIIILSSFVKIFKYSKSLEIQFFAAVLIFFSIHFFAEGYLLAAGSGLCFTFWLILGLIYDKLYIKFKLN